MSGILHSLRKYWVFRNPGWLSKVSRSVDSMLPKLFEKMLKGKDLGDYIAAAGKPGAGGGGGGGGAAPAAGGAAPAAAEAKKEEVEEEEEEDMDFDLFG